MPGGAVGRGGQARRKGDLRRELGRRRRAVPAQRAAAAARAAAEHLRASAPFAACRSLALYAALPGELPTAPFYEVARAAGRELLWPRVTAADVLEFAACLRWEDLRPGRYGVLSPPPARAARPLARGDLVLAPGVAFDAAGHRLGRGGGHYDRALGAAAPGVLVLGVGFDFQRIEVVPVEPHDVPVSGVLTECGLYRSLPE